MKQSIYYEIEDKDGNPRYTEIYMDVTNKCNALCKWCLTGRANLQNKTQKQPIHNLSKDDFQSLVEHLLKHKIITEDACFRIYNWYEPSLNPELPDIINYCEEKGLTIDISTNCGKRIDFDRVKTTKHFKGFLFSMPGFSQKSYDRIHKLNFEKVKDNIRYTVQRLKKKGFSGDIYINFHLYQFNTNEVKYAKEFADELGVRFHCIYAYFNGTGESREYLENTISVPSLKEASKDLFFHYIDDLFENKDYLIHRLSEPESITLSERLNVIPGRGSNDDDAIVSIFDLKSYEEVKNIYDPQREALLKNEVGLKGWVWGHSYKVGRNKNFGFEDLEYV